MDQGFIRQIKHLYEEKTGWGDSDLWNNQDFLELRRMIFDQTGIVLSHVTLKRIWGKVRYKSLPHTSTLNTIVQFLGYRNWRDFCVKNASELSAKATEDRNSVAVRSSAAVASPIAVVVESLKDSELVRLNYYLI